MNFSVGWKTIGRPLTQRKQWNFPKRLSFLHEKPSTSLMPAFQTASAVEGKQGPGKMISSLEFLGTDKNQKASRTVVDDLWWTYGALS